MTGSYLLNFCLYKFLLAFFAASGLQAKLHPRLGKWRVDVGLGINDVQHAVIGTAHEIPSRLTGCRWLGIFIDLQRQTRVGQEKCSYWISRNAQVGEYEFEFWGPCLK